MIKIKLNLQYYKSKKEPIDKEKVLVYYYPLNEGIYLNEKNEISYYDKSLIEQHFEKIEPDCFCYLDNNLSIIFLSKDDKQYNRFVRLVKINNIIYDNSNR